jgi:hypothetical protein
VRAVKIEKRFTGSQAKGKGSGCVPGNGTAIVAFTHRPEARSGKECWNAFAKAWEPGEVNAELRGLTSGSKFMRRPNASGVLEARFRAGRGIQTADRGDTMTGEAIRREVRSSAELQEVCLRTLRRCPGFEQVNEILIQPRDNAEGSANWTLAAVRPRVDNRSLRAARETIGFLQQTYRLIPGEAQGRDKRRV